MCIPTKATGYGTCEACEKVNTGTVGAYDEAMAVHYFCTDCANDGTAIAHLERLAG